MDDPAVLVAWEAAVGDILDRTARFPKSARFTFAARIDGLALDILELLVEARWSPPRAKRELLRKADVRLARLLVLLRLSHDRRYLDSGGFEHVVRAADGVGRMVGGWRRQVESVVEGP